MYKLGYQIKNLSPLIITTNVGDVNMITTVEYIPGSSLLGAFAARYIPGNRLNGPEAHKEETFNNLFLSNGLVFTNAYICSIDEKGKTIDEKEKTIKNLPIPLSIHHEKGEEETFYDLLLDCDIDDRQMVMAGGFGHFKGDNLFREPVKKRINFHHRRDPQRGTSEEGVIFNYRCIEAGKVFEGNILGSKENLDRFLTHFEKESILYLGRSRNSQYGKSRFEIISSSPEAYYGERDAQNPDNINEYDSGKLTLTLHSNTIIYNDCGYSTVDPNDLERVLKRDITGDLKITKSFIRTGFVESFVSVWKMRMPSDRCFLPGSCFMLEGIPREKHHRLIELQKSGIGERRGEGLGRVVFGLQNKETLKADKHKKRKTGRPVSSEAPGETKKIVTNLSKELIKRFVEKKALLDAADFDVEKLPSKSTTGRVEAMAKTQDRDQFQKSLERLRKTAKDQLEHCRNSSHTMYEFLTSHRVEISQILNDKFFSDTKLREFSSEAGYDPENDMDLERELFILYYKTFFGALRRVLKINE